MGPVATTVMASFMGSLGTSLAGMPLLAAAAFMAWALVRILFRKYCSGYISRLPSSRNNMALYQSFQ